MKILWFTWKDLQHPLSGGAEVVNEELIKRLAAQGHEVILLVGGFKGCVREEFINLAPTTARQGAQISGGRYRIIRLGNRYTTYWQAYRYYKKNLRGWADLIIDELNTVPYLVKFYAHEPTVLFVHMLCRRIWFYQIPFPVSLIGYLAEPLYLYLLNKSQVITISQSTKLDLLRYGFKEKNISIISEGTQLSQLPQIETIQKYDTPTLLSLGCMRSMKRTEDQIKAFALLKLRIKNCKLRIAGESSSAYGRRILKLIKQSPYAADIEYLGKVTDQQKIELLQRCHVIMATSVKEGWGLIVTEAASQGTPAVVYDVDGLRDSVRHTKTGLLCSNNTPLDLAENIFTLLSNPTLYNQMRNNAWRWSTRMTFDQSYQDFKKALNL